MHDARSKFYPGYSQATARLRDQSGGFFLPSVQFSISEQHSQAAQHHSSVGGSLWSAYLSVCIVRKSGRTSEVRFDKRPAARYHRYKSQFCSSSTIQIHIDVKSVMAGHLRFPPTALFCCLAARWVSPAQRQVSAGRSSSAMEREAGKEPDRASVLLALGDSESKPDFLASRQRISPPLSRLALPPPCSARGISGAPFHPSAWSHSDSSWQNAPQLDVAATGGDEISARSTTNRPVTVLTDTRSSFGSNRACDRIGTDAIQMIALVPAGIVLHANRNLRGWFGMHSRILSCDYCTRESRP